MSINQVVSHCRSINYSIRKHNYFKIMQSAIQSIIQSAIY